MCIEALLKKQSNAGIIWVKKPNGLGTCTEYI